MGDMPVDDMRFKLRLISADEAPPSGGARKQCSSPVVPLLRPLPGQCLASY
jgi:hypothetical protein